MLRFRLSDLNEDLRRQAELQLAPRREGKGAGSPRHSQPPPACAPEPRQQPKPQKPSLAPYKPKFVASPQFRPSRGTPNATERDYNEKVLGGKGRYEPVVLRLPGGNYTPDWMTIDDGVPTFHECKGSYRFGSESRAVLAFLSAAAAFPFWRFVWAQKAKGVWRTKRVLAPGDTPDTASDPAQEPSAQEPAANPGEKGVSHG